MRFLYNHRATWYTDRAFDIVGVAKVDKISRNIGTIGRVKSPRVMRLGSPQVGAARPPRSASYLLTNWMHAWRSTASTGTPNACPLAPVWGCWEKENVRHSIGRINSDVLLSDGVGVPIVNKFIQFLLYQVVVHQTQQSHMHGVVGDEVPVRESRY